MVINKYNVIDINNYETAENEKGLACIFYDRAKGFKKRF